jgi:hypothetical protein
MRRVNRSRQHTSVSATFTLHVVAPVLIGATIYLLYRSENLYVFRWVAEVGGSSYVNSLRGYMAGSGKFLPPWVRFVLPDGLWVYALTSCLVLVWGASGGRASLFWISSGIGLSVASEICQAAGYISGTFDPLDLLASIVAFAMAMLLLPATTYVHEASLLGARSRCFRSTRGGKC